MLGAALELTEDLPLPFGRAEAVLVEVDDEGNPVHDASTRSATCVKTLCIQRGALQPASGNGKFYVYHRDADNTGWSALLTEIDWWNDLPLGGWASFVLYDEQGLPICIDENDVIFVLEHPGSGAAPFSINVTICENGAPPSGQPESFAIGGYSQYMWGQYDPSGKAFCTQGSDNSPCNDITFSSMGDGPGTVRFLSTISGNFVDLPVPTDPGNDLTWPRGPVVGMWRYTAHNSVRGTGGYTRNCVQTSNDYAIGGNSGWHGVILNNRERWCYLHY